MKGNISVNLKKFSTINHGENVLPSFKKNYLRENFTDDEVYVGCKLQSSLIVFNEMFHLWDEKWN